MYRYIGIREKVSTEELAVDFPHNSAQAKRPAAYPTETNVVGFPEQN